MKISTIDRASHKVIAQRITETLKDLGKELGVTLESSGGQFGGTTGMVKIQVSVEAVGTGPGALSGIETEYRRHMDYMRLNPDSFGQTFFSQGVGYRVSGINPNAPKYPIQANRIHDGVTFRFPSSIISSKFPIEEKEKIINFGR